MIQRWKSAIFSTIRITRVEDNVACVTLEGNIQRFCIIRIDQQEVEEMKRCLATDGRPWNTI